MQGLGKYLKEGCKIYRQSISTDNDMKESIKVFSEYETISGLMRQLQGDEKISAMKETEIATNRFYCYPTDLQVGDRILYLDGEYYDVVRINNVMDMDSFLQVDCKVAI